MRPGTLRSGAGSTGRATIRSGGPLSALHDRLTDLLPQPSPLPDAPVAAFVAALEALDWLAPPPSEALHHVVADRFGWVRFEVPGWQQTGFYVDPLADPAGAYRVIVRDESTWPGTRWDLFPSLIAAADWLVATRRGERPDLPQTPDDAWEARAGSIAFDEVCDELEARAIEDQEPGWQARLGELADRAAGRRTRAE